MTQSSPKKIMPVEAKRRLSMLLPALAVLWIGGGFMQNMIDPDSKKLHPKDNSTQAMGGLNNEFLLLPLLGFREAAAGLLWVRCDEFFHSGDYDAILPLVRLITWLDPHADNVYSTGAWHLDYNFTDSSERSDRRYIPPALALLDEGIENNNNIFDIKFEKGWQCYDKVKDFRAAEAAFLRAIRGPKGDGYGARNGKGEVIMDTDGELYFPYAAPLKVNHLLAHAYEKMGRIPEALKTWQEALELNTKMSKGKEKDFALWSLRQAEIHNYNEAKQRYYNRYTADKSKHDAANPSSEPAVFQVRVGGSKPDTFDVGFSANIQVTKPNVFKISGDISLADGARVDVRISDLDYKDSIMDPILRTFDPPNLSQTILIDSIAIKHSKFSREMDMSKDQKMYSFTNKDNAYKIVITFNPRTTSPHIQDYSGWSGEGLSDVNPAHMLNESHPETLGTKMIEGLGGEGPVWDGSTYPFEPKQSLRLIRITYKINLAQVNGEKPITNADIIPTDANTTWMLK